MSGEFDEPGERYPAIAVYDTAGTALDLLSAGGGADFVVLSYCAMWCVPCQDFADAVPDLQSALGSNVSIVEVVLQSFGTARARVSDAAQWQADHALAGPVLSVDGDNDLYDRIADGAGITSFPTYHLVRADTGKLVATTTGFDTSAGIQSFFEGAIAAYRPPAASMTRAGNDDPERFAGRSGDDSLSGRGGDDRLSGKEGYDTLSGGAGDDRLFGGAAGDILRGDGGADRIFGDAGVDLLRGGAGRDHLDGGSGDDTLYGGGGRDVLRAAEGFDTIYGGGGNDRLVSDEIVEGSGIAADLFGGAGRDRFVLISGGGTIRDLEPDDRIVIPATVARVDLFGFGGNVDIFLEDADGATIGIFSVPDASEQEVEAVLRIL